MDKKRKHFEEHLKFGFTSIGGKKNSEAVVCFVQRLYSVLMLGL